MIRMDYKYFKEILNLIEPGITPQEIIGGNKVISAAERLILSLRFLATGDTFQSMSFQFRISDRTISYIVKDVCDAIVKYLVPLYLKVPSSEEEWLTIADKFQSRWQYPNAIGAIDGKHVVIRKPSHDGSHYYNHKHSHSIILMAIAGPSTSVYTQMLEQTVELMMVVFGINYPDGHCWSQLRVSIRRCWSKR